MAWHHKKAATVRSTKAAKPKTVRIRAVHVKKPPKAHVPKVKKIRSHSVAGPHKLHNKVMKG